MTEQAYRFSASAIDKLNKDPDTQRLRSWHFALLMGNSAFAVARLSALAGLAGTLDG
jgi:hypothetical protein